MRKLQINDIYSKIYDRISILKIADAWQRLSNNHPSDSLLDNWIFD